MSEISIISSKGKNWDVYFLWAATCYILLHKTGQKWPLQPPRVSERGWCQRSVSGFEVHKFSLLITALLVCIHWEYNSQHATCQEFEKILYSQMISHYLLHRALKDEDDKRKSSWESMKSTLTHREERYPDNPGEDNSETAFLQKTDKNFWSPLLNSILSRPWPEIKAEMQRELEERI